MDPVWIIVGVVLILVVLAVKIAFLAAIAYAALKAVPEEVEATKVEGRAP